MRAAVPNDKDPSLILDRRTFLAASLGGRHVCLPAGFPTTIHRLWKHYFERVLSRDALGQAELVRNKQVKPIELVEAVIERIDCTGLLT